MDKGDMAEAQEEPRPLPQRCGECNRIEAWAPESFERKLAAVRADVREWVETGNVHAWDRLRAFAEEGDPDEPSS